MRETTLTLTGDEKQALIEKCKTWIRHLEGEYATRWSAIDRFIKQSQDDFSWRGGKKRDYSDAVGVSNIFNLSNESLNIAGSFSEFMQARTFDDVFGSTPFFLVKPHGKSDAPLAETIQKHTEWRFERANLVELCEQAIDNAYVCGTNVMRIAYEPRVDTHKVLRSVLFFGNKSFLTIAGEYVFEDDGLVPIVNPETGEPIGVAPSKYPDLLIDPAQAQWKEIAIEETTQVGEPLTAYNLHHRNFLCPPDVENIEDSPFVASLSKVRLSDLIATYDFDAATATLLRYSADSSKTKTDQADKGESQLPFYADPLSTTPDNDPWIEIAECFVRVINGNAVNRQYVIIAHKADTILHADYAWNVTPEGKLPFFPVRVFPVVGTWYGKGYYETLQNTQNFVDSTLNAIAYRNKMSADPVKFYHPENIDGLNDHDELVLEPGKLFRLRNGKKAQDALEFMAVPDLDSRTWDLMQSAIQFAQLRTGISSASQGGLSELPQSNTATGIQAIISSGNVLSKKVMFSMKAAFQRAFAYAMCLVYSNLDEEEVFYFTDGDVSQEATLTREQVQRLKFDVEFTLSRFHLREQRESATLAIQTSMNYMNIPEPEKAAVRPLFIQVIKALGFSDADDIVRSAKTAEEMQAEQEAALAEQQASQPTQQEKAYL